MDNNIDGKLPIYERMNENYMTVEEAIQNMMRMKALFRKYPHSKLCSPLYEQAVFNLSSLEEQIQENVLLMREFMYFERVYLAILRKSHLSFDVSRYEETKQLWQEMQKSLKNLRKERKAFDKEYARLLGRQEWIMNEEEVNQVLHFTSFSFIGQMGLFLNVTLFLETMQKFIYFMGENRIENKPWYLFEIAFGFLCTFYSSALAR